MRTYLALALLSATAAWLSGCPGDTPDQPCELACTEHGTCVIVQGREACLCDAGYQGERCGGCEAGYHREGDDCLPDGPDPCQPNPCTEPQRGVCAPDGAGGHTCACDADAQDLDGDGACWPTCAAALAGAPTLASQPCDDSSGLPLLAGTRTCAARVVFDPGAEAFAELYVRGEFNAWGLTHPMTHGADGRFSLDLQLAAGEYAYKLFSPAGERWFEDPGNPFHRWVGGERNSRLRVPDCQRPLLWLLGRPDGRAGRARFAVQYLDGAAAAGLGPDGVRVTRDGLPVDPAALAWDGTSGVLRVDEGALPAGKHLYHLAAADAAGRQAERLFVPVWVAAGEDAAPFDWRDAVLYFALTDRFLNGDQANDAPVAGVDPKANWQGGDFAGLRQAVEQGYFEALGVNTLWLSSISQNTAGGWVGDFNRSSAGYHSYWPISTGWRGDAPLPGVLPVDPHFGSLAEFQELVRVAHARGLRVLVDLVANHVHQDSPLWSQHQADQPAWFYQPVEVCQDIDWARPITCWFAPYLPDLDYTNGAALAALVEHAVWLIEETGVDGFRLDAVKHMIDDFVLELRGRVSERLRMTGERFYMVGETFTGEGEFDLLGRYIGPDMLDGQFDFPLYWQTLSVLLREERDLGALEGMLRENDGRYGEFAIMSTFLGNHDVCRALSHAAGEFGDMWCNGGKEQGWSDPPGLPADEGPFQRLRLAWAFLLTSPGVPLIYYGDELGVPGAGDPDNRRMMQFAPGLSPAQQATLEAVQRLLAARRVHPAMRAGTRSTLLLDGDRLLWAYALESGDDLVVVALNRAPEARSRSLDVGALGLADGATLDEVLTAAEASVQAGALQVELPGRTAGVWVIR
ncbi:MAG TPA: alpha-amylase family glycosyl hydrolase [Myxococcota bacterium]|nr:alpha-amylase family glycosyl hydrolase [Myxococcota bacterium]HRY92666.1 alpha-amylase family glycosyl hydrolase [Myxococcota bacterium]HSA21559.1 alpha-amylase family glycosyl hydrolase [Myxococcota bacterium]